jgi:hypothetical protein
MNNTGEAFGRSPQKKERNYRVEKGQSTVFNHERQAPQFEV